MKNIKKITPQVGLRRTFLVVLDAALILFSFYFALLLRADGAVEAAWWPHNRALLYENLPWITALYLISFLWAGCTPFYGSTRASTTSSVWRA